MRFNRFCVLGIITGAVVCLAGPRPKVSDYPAHAEFDGLSIGAEYLVHSIPSGTQTYYSEDFLVVEVAIYPKTPLDLKPSDFKLRLNEKREISIQTPEFVAYSMKSGGMPFDQSQGSVHQPRFPGDSSGTPPQAPPPPDPDHPEEQGLSASERMGHEIARLALAQGEITKPRNGFLYFPYSQKVNKIKSLQLVYSDHGKDLTLNLF